MALTRVTKTGNITVDGDIGIGVVPGEWSVNYPAFQIGQGGTFTGHRNNTQTQLGQNWWVGTGNQYVVNGAASRMIMNPDSTIIFSQAPSGTAGATMSTTHNRLVINPSGHVTTPSQPAFSIYGDTNPNWTSDVIYLGHTGSGAAAFDTNIGNHFSYTTGKFTAPVAGTYFFSFRATTADTNQHFIDIYKNGARVGGHTLSYSYAYLTAANTAVLTLASGDYIEARRRASGYSFYTTNFSGFLIG